ncbi:MAG TPA: LutB/LldF family L-lactate oxidation iron-sulfur protein [Candidatus Binataceae bacterium]|nr:LutB/LldF family L-lactate oxidation iron-sulfur protein [Candidatus Binataceae bacterium]
MTEQPGSDFFKATQNGVADLQLRRKLDKATGRHLEHVAAMRAEFPPFDTERDVARKIKQDTIARLDQLLIELKEHLEANGFHVFVASDAKMARDYILELARTRGVKRAVKGKSMTAEEIELNPALEQAGIEPIETDLGEYIVQLRGEKPSHIITPAIHLSREDIGATFSERLNIAYTPQPEELTAVARERLRSMFLTAEMGITGVNFAIAETGTLVLVENEGNGRLSSTLPETMVALMGIEKVIPRLDDLPHFLEILARTSTGQKLTCYTNFINGPRKEGDVDGPREIHVVILDNGRSAMLADPVLREALYCLRCGACLNVCPVYRRIGGHAYGVTYSGPIGSIVSPNLFGSAAAQLPFASTLCGACRDICPVKIDIPRLLLHLRWKENQGNAAPRVEFGSDGTRARRGMHRFTSIARRPRLMRIALRAGAFVARPFARDGYLRWIPGPFRSWTRGRDFPTLRGR